MAELEVPTDYAVRQWAFMHKCWAPACLAREDELFTCDSIETLIQGPVLAELMRDCALELHEAALVLEGAHFAQGCILWPESRLHDPRGLYVVKHQMLFSPGEVRAVVLHMRAFEEQELRGMFKYVTDLELTLLRPGETKESGVHEDKWPRVQEVRKFSAYG